ncbi:PAS domain-containing protein [Bdellovibrio bacteriovorus]|nr:PAS domain-containing protein [Bdellovibrio bacteriovorus]
MTLYCLFGILFLSTLYAGASIMLPALTTTHTILYIILAPSLACFGIATSHASNLESEKAKNEYERIQARLSEVESSQITLDRFFSISSDLMAVAGSDGFLKKVSASLIKALGHSEETLLTTPFFDFIHPDDQESTRKCIEALNLGLRQVGFENRYRTKDGSYRTLSWSAAADRELGVRFASARDITFERDFRTLVEQIIDATPFYLLVQDQDGKISKCNNKFAHTFGVSKESLIGKNAEDYLPKDLVVLVKEKMKEFEITTSPQPFESKDHTFKIFPIFDNADNLISVGIFSSTIDMKANKSLEG